jgi:tRNA pseudouridine38-40 synthase
VDEGSQRAKHRIALLLEYDGGRFSGSQRQEQVVTVQSVLEEAITSVTGEEQRVAFAGRTDAGVHACGQVAAFDTQSRLASVVLLRALNARLPADVVVLAASEVATDFDPRRQAKRRHYRYLVRNNPVRSALDRGRAWHVSRPLDIETMREAARGLVGRHDFAAFASPLDDADASTVREVCSFDVNACGDRLSLDVSGNAFLPHQVRRMVGALVEAGKGKLTADDYGALLEGRPASAGPTAPAHGLYLMGVDYAETLFGVQVDSENQV